MPMAKEVGRVELIARIQYGFACIQEASGRLDVALQSAEEALKIYEKLQHGSLREVQKLIERLEKKIKAGG